MGLGFRVLGFALAEAKHWGFPQEVVEIYWDNGTDNGIYYLGMWLSENEGSSLGFPMVRMIIFWS